jgi:hypothetical protein
VRLVINGDQVSYALENEKTLGEVVRGVRQWLAAAGFHVSGMRADGRDLMQGEPREWEGIDVAAVGELGVAARHTADLRIEHWRTVQAWLQMLAEELAAAGGPAGAVGASSVLQDLLSNFPETLAGFQANPFLPPGSTAVERFTALFGGSDAAAVRSWPAERRAQARALVEEINGALTARLADAQQPRAALARCAGRIRTLLGGLGEVSVLLQTGRDRAAMDIVIGFSDAVQGLLELLPFLPPDTERARLIGELNPFLKDLVAAFDARDTVMIGDLLEYEISPRMERLAPLLEGA